MASRRTSPPTMRARSTRLSRCCARRCERRAPAGSLTDRWDDHRTVWLAARARSRTSTFFSDPYGQRSLEHLAVTVLVPQGHWRAPLLLDMVPWHASVRKGRPDRLRSIVKVTALPSLEVIGPVPDVIARAKLGDRAAFAELYDRHVDSVYRYLLYRVREPSDAEDLTSEVFTRAFANIHRYRWQGKSFLAWLYTIARNAVTDRRRRDRPTVDLDNAYGVAEEGPTAHERAIHGEAVDALRGAVKHLTTEQQEVIVLRFVENMSSRQVAKVLGKNEGAIRALQFRALGRLRKLLTSEVA